MTSVNPERFRNRFRKCLSAPISVAAGTTGDVVAAIQAVAGGPGTGLPGSPAQSIEVVGFVLGTDTAHGTFQFLSSTGSIALTGAMNLPVDGQLVVPLSMDKYFQTAPGDKLQLAAVTGAVRGWVNYVLSPGQSPTTL